MHRTPGWEPPATPPVLRFPPWHLFDLSRVDWVQLAWGFSSTLKEGVLGLYLSYKWKPRKSRGSGSLTKAEPGSSTCRISSSDTEVEDMKARALELSLKYNFVTPLTSMVVTKPEGQEKPHVINKAVEKEQDKVTARGPFRYVSMGRAGTRHRGIGNTQMRPKRPSSKPHPSIQLLDAVADYQPMPFRRGLDSSVDKTHTVSSDHLEGRLRGPSKSGPSLLLEATMVAPTEAYIKAPHAILPLPGQSGDQICVDLKSSQGLLELISDPEKGLQVMGYYEEEKGHFSWIEVTFKDNQLVVRATPEHIVVTRGSRSTSYKWKKTLFAEMPSLKMTMDRDGLLLLRSTNSTIMGLKFWHGPGQGLKLLLQDPDYFSNQVGGILGQFYQNVVWGPLEEADDSKRTLSVQGQNLLATRKQKLDYQKKSLGAEISCWLVEL